MKTEITRYPKKYRTQQERFIYIFFWIYGTTTNAAKKLNVSRQYLSQLMREGEIPLGYASYLADQHALSLGLFNYLAYCMVKGITAYSYGDLLKQHADWFLDDQLDYILKGKEMPEAYILLTAIWKKILRPSKRKQV